MPISNVILYGETGSGKSSVVNMIPGDAGEIAGVSNAADGVTMKATCFKKSIHGKPFNVWDTPGLSEGQEGAVNGNHAIEILHNLISSCTGGVSLLVLVMRGPRINALLHKNYNLLYRIICATKVPIVLIVTGLDVEEERKVWWDTNKSVFHQFGILPQGHACCTTLERLGTVYQNSRDDIINVINAEVSHTPWQMPTIPVNVAGMINRLLNFIGVKKIRERDLALFEALKDIYGEENAKKIMKRISSTSSIR